MDWLIGIVSGLASAALWSVVAWAFVRAQREALRDIQAGVQSTRSWVVHISADRGIAYLTYVGRGNAQNVRIGLQGTNPPHHIAAAKIKHGRTVTQHMGDNTNYLRVDHLARPAVTGPNRLMKLLWLDRLEYRQDVVL